VKQYDPHNPLRVLTNVSMSQNKNLTTNFFRNTHGAIVFLCRTIHTEEEMVVEIGFGILYGAYKIVSIVIFPFQVETALSMNTLC
jgi:hypothetical protein